MTTDSGWLLRENIMYMSSGLLLGIWERICRARYFRDGLMRAASAGAAVAGPLLPDGHEVVPASMSYALHDFSPYFYCGCNGASLSWGGEPARLRDCLLGVEREGGMPEGGGPSAGIPSAVGEALGRGRKTVCFIPAGTDEDRVIPAMGVAATHGLPVLFVMLEYGSSSGRRGRGIALAANALGMASKAIVDDPLTIHASAMELRQRLPAFLDICCGHLPSDGANPCGCEGFAVIRRRLWRIGLQEQVERIEKEARGEMDAIWGAPAWGGSQGEKNGRKKG